MERHPHTELSRPCRAHSLPSNLRAREALLSRPDPELTAQRPPPESPACLQGAETPLPRGFLRTVRGQRGTWGAGEGGGLPGEGPAQSPEEPFCKGSSPSRPPPHPLKPQSGFRSRQHRGSGAPPHGCLLSPSTPVLSPPLPSTDWSSRARLSWAQAVAAMEPRSTAATCAHPPKPKPPLGSSPRVPHTCLPPRGQ